MKKFRILAILSLLSCTSAFAQYTPTKEGAKFTYKETITEGNKSLNYTNTVDKVETADGLTTVTVISELPDENPLADPMRMTSVNTYKSAEEPTTIYLMRGEDYKNFLLDLLSKSGEVSPQQLDQVKENFRAKGDLSLVLDPKAEAGAKIPNSHMRIDMGMQAATTFVNKGTVVGFEDVTTEAGTFPNCIKVTYEKRENSPMGSNKATVTEWYAQGIGCVKSIATDKKGNVLEESELIKIENN